MEFKKVTKNDGEYDILSGSDGLILKIEQNEIRVLQKIRSGFFCGVETFNLFGKDINVDDAVLLLKVVFFEGGKLSIIIDPDKNTLSYLELADAGLGLPNVTLRAPGALDFALNRFKGSLRCFNRLSSKQGEDAISANQVLVY